MSRNLHLEYVPERGSRQRYDASYGVIVLSAAGSFQVAVPAYRREIEAIDTRIRAKVAEDREGYDRFMALRNAKATDGWTAAEVAADAANLRIREQTHARIGREIQALEAGKGDVQRRFADVKWCWQVVGDGLAGDALEHNPTFDLGVRQSQYAIDFPKLLEGGGLAWLEIFRDTDPATGQVPHGFFVQATGTPRIIRTEWTDHQCNPITGPVAFGSEVLLNVYTEGMYGHEIRIQLIDEDFWILPDDTLPFSPGSDFLAEVDIHRVQPPERGKPGVAGLLPKDEDARQGTTPPTEQFIQKSAVKVLVNRAWKDAAGSSLKIYPIIKSVVTGEPFEGFERTYLEVAETGRLLDDPSGEYPITPTFIGQVATDVGAFHPCKYEEIRFAPVPETDKDKARIIFNREKNGPGILTIPIICAGTDRMSDYTITLLQLDTRECRFRDEGRNHTGRSLRARTPPENFRAESGDGTTLPFKAGFRYPAVAVDGAYGLVQMLPFIWPAHLPSGHDTPLVVDAETCRYDKEIKVLAYPDVVWALDFRFGLAGPVQSTHTNLPTYDRGGGENGRTNSRRSQAQSGAIIAGNRNSYGLGRRPNGLELEFQLVLEAEYNKGEKIELAAKYAAKIRNALELMLTVKEKVDEYMHIDKVREGQRGLLTSISRRLNRAPMTGSLDYPVISIGGKWQAAVNTETNTVYTDGKLVFRLNPLMKAEISIDLVAAASYVGPWKVAVSAVETALAVAGAQLDFFLTLFGVVNVEGEYAFADSGGSNLNVNGELGLKLRLSATVRVNMNAVLFEVNGELKAEGYAVTSFKPKVAVGHDTGGMYLDAKIEWTGVKIVCTFAATANGRTVQTDEAIPVIDGQEFSIKPYIISK